jgi:hypothetical protein
MIASELTITVGAGVADSGIIFLAVGKEGSGGGVGGVRSAGAGGRGARTSPVSISTSSTSVDGSRVMPLIGP